MLEHLPAEAEIRLALEYRAKEYEKQMRVLPDSLPLPVFPAKPDWKNIGWEAFDGANLLNCILSRINPFYLDQYANSSYRNPSQILTESPHNLKLVRETELDRLAHEISEKVQPKKPSIDWKLIGRVTLIVGGIAILTCVNAMSGGSLTPLQMALIAGATGAVVDGGGEIISNLSDGEPVNWGAVAARTAGGGAKGAIFSIPGLGFAKTTASVMGVAAAENYAYNRANGVDPQEALGNAVANGVVEGTVAGLIDQGAKKFVGMCAKPKPEPKLSHPSPKPLPEPGLQPLSEAELEKVVGGAKDPSWRPGGAASAEKPKAPRPKSDSQLVINKGQEIVGTEFSEIKPTQIEINSERVQYYIQKLKMGDKLDPIIVVNVDGKGKFLIEGHHRYVASKRLGVKIDIIEVKGGGPIGMKNWGQVEWIGWNGSDWIYR